MQKREAQGESKMVVQNNIEKKVIAFLKTVVPAEWKVFGEIPESRPDQYILVERTGGPSDMIGRVEEPELIISFTHKTSQQIASDMAIATDIKIVRDLKAINEISRVQRLSLVRLDDLVTKERRYQGYYSIVHHLT